MTRPGGQRQDPVPFPEKVVAINRALATAKIPYAIGGALLLAFYAEPRATADVDVNVFVPTERWPDVRAALEPLGIDVSADETALARDGQVRLWWGRNPVDLFFSYDPFHDAMQGAVRRVRFGNARMPILAPEHLVICKAMFDRPKDWLDIEAVLIVTQPLDIDAIRTWLTRMVGDEDERLAKLEDLLERLGLHGGQE